MNAETIAKALGGRKAGGGWMARCPAHDDRDAEPSIRDADDGKVLVRCHAGCDQERRHRGPCGRAACGPRTVRARISRTPRRMPVERKPDQRRRQAQRGRARHLAVRKPATGTLVETYLASRGLHLPPPPTLRFHAGLKHPSGGIWPAMVALVTQRRGRTRRSRSIAPSSPATAAAKRRSSRRR